MNVHLYVGIVIVVGLIASYFLGRLPSKLGLVAGALVSAAASVVLGVVLSFPLLQATNRICEVLGYNSATCIATDDRTVWALAFPLAAFPLYFLIMFYANRAQSSSNQEL